MRSALALFLVFITLPSPAMADLTEEARHSIEFMCSTMERDGALDINGTQIMTTVLSVQFYAENGYEPVWVDPATVEKLLSAIKDIRNDGLNSADYHEQALSALGKDLPQDSATLAERDIMMTDALFAMLYHLTFGKADPSRLDKDWNLNAIYEELDITDSAVLKNADTYIVEAIAKGDLDSLIKASRPEFPLYTRLRTGLTFYLELAAAGGWTPIPAGPTLRLDDDDPRVPTLRKRLALTGDYTGSDLTSTVIDEDLVVGIKAFQARHGLEDDGIAGKGTLAALNVPAETRVQQIKTNLERSRWVMNHDIGDDLIVVNIAAFDVRLFRNRELEWRSLVMVGKPYTATPIFADEVVYLEFNPTWTVPASISNTSILTNAKADPEYFAANHMVLLDGKGREVDPASVDWANLNRMPYTVRQEPGPHNALGLVKFMFPNPHAVYLHDTPSRQLFGRSARAFSHGCIRLENPFDLAELLLDDQPQWSRAKIDEVVESGKRTTVRLSESLPILLLYLTAYTEEDGRVQFRQDLYDRDAAVLKALAGPVKPHQRHAN